MTVTELWQLFLGNLELLLSGSGFSLNRRTKRFARPIEGGRQEIALALVNHNPVYHVSPFVTIRIEAVESICNLFSGVLPEYQAATCTTLIKLKQFTRDGKDEYRVTTKEDVLAAVSDFGSILSARIIPFLDHHQDILSLHAWETDALRVVDQKPGIGDAMTSVVLAHLSGDPRFDRIVAHFDKELRGFIAPEKAKFDNLVAYLRS